MRRRGSVKNLTRDKRKINSHPSPGTERDTVPFFFVFHYSCINIVIVVVLLIVGALVLFPWWLLLMSFLLNIWNAA